MNDLFDLAKKTVIVTGGNGYLGTSICEGLAQYRATVIVASRNCDGCRALADHLSKQYHTEAIGMSVDICNTESVQNLFHLATDRYGKIDVLINNAFVPVQGCVECLDDEVWNRGLDGTASAVFRCIREVMPYMVENKQGKIINIASMYGVVAPDPATYGNDVRLNNPACYGAGKAAVIQLTKYVASYYGRYGIISNCISPGSFPNMDTQSNKDFIDKLSEKTILGRIGYPEDLKGITVFLSSDASNYITGQNIIVDGGVTVR